MTRAKSSFFGAAYFSLIAVLLWIKVFGYGDISWWTATAPLWGPVALFMALCAVALVVCVLGVCLVILGLGAAMRTMVESAAKVAVEHNRKMRRADQVREQAERN